MAASAGTLYAVGQSGRQYIIDLYLPDAVAGVVQFNPSGVATTTSGEWRVPENMTVTDISVITGTTAVGAVLYKDKAVINGATIRYANHLNTLNNRPALRIGLNAGSFLSAIQI